jgi:anamorsin
MQLEMNCVSPWEQSSDQANKQSKSFVNFIVRGRNNTNMDISLVILSPGLESASLTNENDVIIIAKEEKKVLQLLSMIHDKSCEEILIRVSNTSFIDDNILQHIFRLLKPLSQVKIICDAVNLESLRTSMTIQGFSKIDVLEGNNGVGLSAFKPSWDIGSSAAVKLQPAVSAWKITSDNLMEDDIIDEDELLNDGYNIEAKDESGGCGVEDETTGKRRACKNCSCGLAEELAAEETDSVKKVATESKSACGNCSKGDAFRCASCPYLGLPAFEAGQEKLVLSMKVSDF